MFWLAAKPTTNALVVRPPGKVVSSFNMCECYLQARIFDRNDCPFYSTYTTQSYGIIINNPPLINEPTINYFLLTSTIRVKQVFI